MRRLLPGLLAALLLAGCSGEDTPSAGDKGYVDGKGIVTRLAPDDRRPLAGPLEPEWLSDKPASLSKL